MSLYCIGAASCRYGSKMSAMALISEEIRDLLNLCLQCQIVDNFT